MSRAHGDHLSADCAAHGGARHRHRHHGHGGHDHGPKPTAGNKGRILVAAVLTTGFMIAEAVGGIVTGSLALLADAGHMLTDSVALILAYIAYRLGDRPGTRRLTYGFGRLKVLVAYTNGLTILLIAGWIVAEAVRRFLHPVPVLGGTMLAIAALGLAVNVAAFAILQGGDRASLNLRGALLHVVGDLLGSVAAIAAAVIILVTGWLPADPLLSVLVALLLFHSAWKLMRESGHILLEGAPPAVDRDAVARDLERAVPAVDGIRHMHVWTLDGQTTLATLHARLKQGADAPAAVAALRDRLDSAHGIGHATVEVENGRQPGRAEEGT